MPRSDPRRDPLLLARLPTWPAFASLDAAGLRRVIGSVRCLSLPARRSLVRPGRALAEHIYLLEGRVQLHQHGRVSVVSAGSERARRPVYPGAAEVETLTAARFVAVAPQLLRTLPAEPPGGPGLPELTDPGASWQGRLLDSPLLQRLRPSAWQHLLNAMERRSYLPAERIIAAGTIADGCFVLCSGALEVRAAGRVLARPRPGTLFGEDGLLSGDRRNASVVACSAVIAARLPAATFRETLRDGLVQPLNDAAGRDTLSLDPALPATLQLSLGRLRELGPGLPAGRRFAVLGGSKRERDLAAFLLIGMGHDAQPVY